MSFNYGNAKLGELGGAEEGMARPDGGPVVTGVTENLSFEIDTWRNGDPEQGVNISGVGEGVELDQLAFENGIILEDGSRKEGTMEISWSPQSGASFKTEGPIWPWFRLPVLQLRCALHFNRQLLHSQPIC